MDKDAFTAAMARVFQAAGCRTQIELAELLDIRQSSVSDAKRRKRIPAEWLLKILRHNQTSPDWISTGEGSRYLRPADGNVVKVVRVTEVKPPEECSAQELVNELVRRALISLQKR